MRISIEWLKEFVDLKEAPDALADMLSMLGFESEVAHDFSSLKQVVVGKVVTAKKHPNADRLKLCTVNDGRETLSVVCGAPNVDAGQTIVFARVGAILPGDFVISKAKIRGEESRGMICSERELGISDEHDGIMVLPNTLKVGNLIHPHLDKMYSALELDLTPNRPDGFSHYGIAREVALKTRRTLKNISVKTLNVKSKDVHTVAKVTIENAIDCPRYMGAVLNNVTVGPSPDWMVERLKAAGQRSINNLVDISNYVLLEMGHPTHIFDFDMIPSNTIAIRRVKNDKTITTLDEVNRKLSKQQLLITDGKKPIALAGIMGGLESAVQDKTNTVFVESAYFDPVTIRKGSKELGLLTEASRRFERGADVNAVETALWRVINLLQEYAGGELIPGIIDEYPGKFKPKSISMRRNELDLFAGCNISDKEVKMILNGLNIKHEKKKDHWKCTPPSFRPDIEREADLIEEIIRVYGYDNIPSSTNYTSSYSLEHPDPEQPLEDLRNLFSAFGYQECQSNTLQSEYWTTIHGRKSIAMMNPLTEHMTHMRTDLLPGLLEAVDFNIKNGSPDLYLFELGNVFIQEKKGLSGMKEISLVCGLMHGNRVSLSAHEQAKTTTVFTVMGHMDRLCKAMNTRTPSFEMVERIGYQQAFTVSVEKEEIGILGTVDPIFVKDLGLEIDHPVHCFSLETNKLIPLLMNQQKFSPINVYPIVERDVDFVFSEEVETGAVSQKILKQNYPNLNEVFPIDIFRHKSVGSDRKSVTFHFRFQHPDKTLEDKEVSSVINKIKRLVLSEFDAKLRSSN